MPRLEAIAVVQVPQEERQQVAVGDDGRRGRGVPPQLVQHGDAAGRRHAARLAARQAEVVVQEGLPLPLAPARAWLGEKIRSTSRGSVSIPRPRRRANRTADCTSRRNGLDTIRPIPLPANRSARTTAAA